MLLSTQGGNSHGMDVRQENSLGCLGKELEEENNAQVGDFYHLPPIAEPP